ncbi:hypothetical protein [Roseomonas sp. 18066]|uniref:hypothetical protein n=1 Tax=Roseomonas sp. 18066 TaxID=2681412 RepID=UPI001357125C|nr:hypothetical protein [Roseomonas sp. 18066]
MTPFGPSGVAPRKGAGGASATGEGGFASQLDSAVGPGRSAAAGLSGVNAPLLLGGGFAEGKNSRSQETAQTISDKSLKKLKLCQLALLQGGNIPSSELLSLAESAESAADSESGESARLCRSIALRLRLVAAQQDAHSASGG